MGDTFGGHVGEGELQEAVVLPELDGLIEVGGMVADLDLGADQRVGTEELVVLDRDQGGLVHAAGLAQQESGIQADRVNETQGGGIASQTSRGVLLSRPSWGERS